MDPTSDPEIDVWAIRDPTFEASGSIFKDSKNTYQIQCSKRPHLVGQGGPVPPSAGEVATKAPDPGSAIYGDILDVKMELKLHLYSVTWNFSSSYSMQKPWIFEIRSHMLKRWIKFADLDEC